MIRILVRKRKDLIKIFASLCIQSTHDLIFKIILRFIIDLARDLDKNEWRDFIGISAGIYSGSFKVLYYYL